MFSVIVTTQDTAVGLKRTLRSVRSQLYPPSEVVLVDRCSNGEAEIIANDFRRRTDIPLKYLHRPGQSLGAACNLGVATSCGKYLTLLTAQDELLPFALEQYCQNFEQHREIEVCYGRYIQRDRAGKLAPSYDKQLPSGDLLEQLFRGSLQIQSSAIAYSRQPIELGHRYPGNLHGLEPIEFLLKLAADFAFHCVQEDVVIVENRSADFTPEHATMRSLLLERLGRELSNRISDAAFAEGLARVNHAAAYAWWKAGNVAQAQEHIRRAMSNAPRSLRFWWLASLIQSRRLLGFASEPTTDAA